MNTRLSGRLTTKPWPRLLYHLWQGKKSGLLELRAAREKASFWFNCGNILLHPHSFPASSLSSFLFSLNSAEAPRLQHALTVAQKENILLLQALVEAAGLTTEAAWNILLHAWKEWFFSLFDLSEGEFSFEPLTPDEDSSYAELITPEIIIAGIRRMKNFSLIEAHLPPENETIQVNPFPQLGLLPFSPPEKYLLRLMSRPTRLEEVYARCEFGRREGQRFVFTLVCLDMISPAANSTPSKRLAEPTWRQWEEVLAGFNEKCAYIYRFISKEIGPVAFNVLEKALDEIRPHLPTLFAEAELQPDGRFHFHDTEKLSWHFLHDHWRQNFLWGLNEILMAEVLAVKRTLGPSFEATLVKNLERIGET